MHDTGHIETRTRDVRCIAVIKVTRLTDVWKAYRCEGGYVETF